MQYMISPMDLTQRQLLIYKVLYDRCDFNTMEVSITIENIVNTIKVADLTYSMVYKDINKMLKKGYIKTVRKAAKGIAPKYKLVKVSEFYLEKSGIPKNTKEYQKKTKTEQFQGVEGCEEYQKKTKEYQKLTNSKDKDKDNNIYSSKFELLWSLYPSKTGKKTSKDKVIKLLKSEKVSFEEFKRCIERYKDYVKKQRETGFNLSYMNGSTFFNGRYEDYLDANYQEKNLDQSEQNNFDIEKELEKYKIVRPDGTVVEN